MLKQIIGVLSLDSDAFKQIEHDQTDTIKALLIVIVSAILAGVGGGIGFGDAMFGVGLNTTSNTTYKILSISVWAVLAWLLWSLITYLIGTKVYHGKATLPEIIRVIGFAYAPLAFQIFAFIPLIGIVIPILAAVWALAAVIIGVNQALELDDYGKTFIIILIGYFVYLIGMGALLTLL